MAQEITVAREIGVLSPDLAALRQQRTGAAASLLSLLRGKSAMTLSRLAEEAEDLDIQRLAVEVGEGLRPAGDKPAAIMIDTVCEVLGTSAPTAGAIAIYLELLGSLPVDLLDLATQRVLKEYRYGGFPKPADWLERVKTELAERSAAFHGAAIYRNRRKVALLYFPPEAVGRKLTVAEQFALKKSAGV